MKGKDDPKDNIKYMKKNEADRLMTHFRDIFISKARFEGMPPEIPDNYPLYKLWTNRCVTFFRLEEADMFLCLPIAEESVVENPYGLPSKWRAVAQGNLASIISSKVLTPENAVLIWCNPSHKAPEEHVRTLVNQMVNVEYTKRLNINAQKMPINVITNDSKVLNDLNVMSKFLEASPTMITDRSVADRLEVVNLGVPIISADLDDTYNRYYCRIMDYLGCDNVNIDKKERLITAEAEANNEQTILKHYAFMETWRQGIKKVNEMFGLNIQVIDVNEDERQAEASEGMPEEDPKDEEAEE